MEELQLTDRQVALLDIVATYHEGQKRKYTEEPYIVHLVEVIEILVANIPELVYTSYYIEIAACHDLIEDTECTLDDLKKHLKQIGYDNVQSTMICNGVSILTDKYTAEAYPALNRQARKDLEAKRLVREATYLEQTITYADLISNLKSIIEHDVNFARIFVLEARHLLSVMNNGNAKLRELAWANTQQFYLQECARID